MTKYTTLALIAYTAAAYTAAQAGTETWFTPLTESAPVTSPNSLEEKTQPWVAPEGILQKNLISLRLIEDEVLGAGRSIVRTPNLGTGGSMFDMIAYDNTGNYLFIPHETLVGAGVTRVSLWDCETDVLFAGDNAGVGTDGSRFTADDDWSNDWGAFDPARFTPYNTVWAGEEWSGEGRIIEVVNPFADPDDIVIREIETIANVSHEGINFSEQHEDTIYYVDEDRSGSIYKYVMSSPGAYLSGGQTFVLSVDNFTSSGGIANENYNTTANTSSIRVGEASWIPLTDENGVTLPGVTDPFTYNQASGLIRPGRNAADDVAGTPYGRPEDCEVGNLANGNEVLYFCATSEATVYSVEMIKQEISGRYIRRGRGYVWVPAQSIDKAIVRVFASESATPKNEGFNPTTAVINSPDNLAQDALGNIYIIEDAPNSSATGGDIWFVRDTDGDGVGESVDHFLSIRVDGAEATGMIFNPVYPEEFVIAVQHPDSTNLDNVPNGMGDSVWMFNLTNVPNKQFVYDLIDAAQ